MSTLHSRATHIDHKLHIARWEYTTTITTVDVAKKTGNNYIGLKYTTGIKVSTKFGESAN